MGQLIALVARARSRESLTCSSCCAISSSQVFVPGLISAQLTRIVESVSIVIMRVTPRGEGGRCSHDDNPDSSNKSSSLRCNRWLGQARRR